MERFFNLALDKLNNDLNLYKLLGKIPSSNDYKILSPLQFEQRIDSFYEAGNKYIIVF